MTLKAAAAALAAALCLVALAGCDRRDQKPMNTAAQQAAPVASKVEGNGPPGATRPEPNAAAPQPDSKTQQEPPVQGQADARQGEQKQHFDGKS